MTTSSTPIPGPITAFQQLATVPTTPGTPSATWASFSNGVPAGLSSLVGVNGSDAASQGPVHTPGWHRLRGDRLRARTSASPWHRWSTLPGVAVQPTSYNVAVGSDRLPSSIPTSPRTSAGSTPTPTRTPTRSPPTATSSPSASRRRRRRRTSRVTARATSPWARRRAPSWRSSSPTSPASARARWRSSDTRPLPPNLVEDDFQAAGRFPGGTTPPPPTAQNCQTPTSPGRCSRVGSPTVVGQPNPGSDVGSAAAGGRRLRRRRRRRSWRSVHHPPRDRRRAPASAAPRPRIGYGSRHPGRQEPPERSCPGVPSPRRPGRGRHTRPRKVVAGRSGAVVRRVRSRPDRGPDRCLVLAEATSWAGIGVNGCSKTGAGTSRRGGMRMALTPRRGGPALRRRPLHPGRSRLLPSLAPGHARWPLRHRTTWHPARAPETTTWSPCRSRAPCRPVPDRSSTSGKDSRCMSGDHLPQAGRGRDRLLCRSNQGTRSASEPTVRVEHPAAAWLRDPVRNRLSKHAESA